jgi:hypothetical protein
MRQYIDLILVTAILTFGAAMLTYVDAGSKGDPPQSKAGKSAEATQGATPGAKDAAGNVDEPSTRRERAVQKDREASQHLGAGSGTSSGTGPGKMQSGSGPR